MKSFLKDIFAILLLPIVIVYSYQNYSGLLSYVKDGESVVIPTFNTPVQASVIGSSAKIIFAGDMMFDRSIRGKTNKFGGDYVFSCIKDTLFGADLVVANLEGPITPYESKSLGSVIGEPDNYTFTFPTSTGETLFNNNIKLVNLGNNHILNFGYGGVVSTKEYLDKAGVRYFGDPDGVRVANEDLNGISFSFINYNEFSRESDNAASTTVDQIIAYKKMGRLPIVFTHWGVEYATSSNEYQRYLGHLFVDSGAVLVIGTHPHVVEGSEVYKDVPIYYSLGNFIFDQYFSDEVKNGEIVEVEFNNFRVKDIKESKVYLNKDGKTCLNK